jgi:hypothetical protein
VDTCNLPAASTHYTVGKYLEAQAWSAFVLSYEESRIEAEADKAYPLVKTFSSDVLPHAPSPLQDARQLRPIPCFLLQNSQYVREQVDIQEHELSLHGLRSTTERHCENRTSGSAFTVGLRSQSRSRNARACRGMNAWHVRIAVVRRVRGSDRWALKSTVEWRLV